MGKDFFVDTFTIQKDSGTVYALYFFSKHIRGFEKMLEAKWDMDKAAGKGWSYEKTIDIFTQGNETNELEKSLIKYLKTPRSNKDIYRYGLTIGFLPKHSTEVLKNLQNKGLIKAVDTSGKPLQKGAFYLPYKNIKQPNIKGLFSIK